MATFTKTQDATEVIENLLQTVRLKKTEEWYSEVKSRITCNDFLSDTPCDPVTIKLLFRIYEELYNFAMDWDGLDFDYEGTFVPAVDWIDWTPENLGMPIRTATKALRHLEHNGLIHDLRIDYADQDSIVMHFSLDRFDIMDMNETPLDEFDSTYRQIKSLLSSLDK